MTIELHLKTLNMFSHHIKHELSLISDRYGLKTVIPKKDQQVIGKSLSENSLSWLLLLLIPGHYRMKMPEFIVPFCLSLSLPFWVLFSERLWCCQGRKEHRTLEMINLSIYIKASRCVPSQLPPQLSVRNDRLCILLFQLQRSHYSSR